MSRPGSRQRLLEFLKGQFGEDISHPKLGPIAVREEATKDFELAEVFVVDTVSAIESGSVADGLMSGGIVVPKDGSPVHWAPTAWPVETYLQRVARGDCWSGTEVTYYALLSTGRMRRNPSGLLRRRSQQGPVVDEAFTRNLRWEPTDYFEKYHLGHNDVEHVEITKGEADAFIARVTEKWSEQP